MRIQLSDELHQTIERQVRDGRAASPAEFLEEAVRRLVEEVRLDDEDIERQALAGIADAENGRVTTIATTADADRLHDRLMSRLKGRSGPAS